MNRDELIRARLRNAANAVDIGTPDPVVTVTHRVRRRRRRRRGAVAVAAVAAALVAVAGGVVLVDGDTEDPPAVTTPGPPVGRELAPGLVQLDAGPLSARVNATVVWTGDELVVWGGTSADTGAARFDGAAYDPSSGEWRTMSPAPLDQRADPSVGVWTGDEVVIVSGVSTAAWDPDTDRWRLLPDAPFAVNDGVAAGTDGELFRSYVDDAVWTGSEMVLALSGSWVALDPGTETWRELPEPPLGLYRITTTWTGEELLMTGSEYDPGIDLRAQTSQLATITYDPTTDRWREVAPGPVSPQATGAAWTGEELVVVGYGMDAAAYDPDADTWTDLPAVPARFFEWNPELAATGDSVVAFMAQAVVVLHDGVWTPLPYEGLQFGDLAVADGTILTFGLDADVGVNSLFALDVETRRRDADVRQVGVAELRQPAGFEFGSAICDDADNECRDGVTVELEGPTSCAVTSSYTLGFGGPPDGERVTIEPLDGSPPFEATLTDPPDGGVHIVGAEVSDRIIVDCDDTEVALEVARSLVVPEYLRNQP